MWKGYVYGGEKGPDEAATQRWAGWWKWRVARTYVGVVSHVIDDALQHRGQRHHGVGASAVDGLVWFLGRK